MVLYRGYSTVGLKFGSPVLEDEEIIKRDLLNHFHIRKGEKLMNPDFGTVIWDFIHDPLTAETKQRIIDDITEIVNSDPRTQVSNIIVTEYEHGIQVECELFYLQLNQTERLLLEFNGNTNSLITS